MTIFERHMYRLIKTVFILLGMVPGHGPLRRAMSWADPFRVG